MAGWLAFPESSTREEWFVPPSPMPVVQLAVHKNQATGAPPKAPTS